ncbi:MAG: nitroreductase family protein [Anaerolineaceae bacterium]|nr:nitroreductase family protein [Anaerolineaceae bacterium]
MDTITAILTRRSVRQFSSHPVSGEDVEMLLRCAMQAPSAGNAQLWQFVILTDRSILDKIREFHPFAEALETAPLAILVCGDDNFEKRPGRWVMDCSAVSENILLAAHAQGLGAVWMSIHPDIERVEGVCKLLKIPDQVHPVSLIAVGHPLEKPEPGNNYKSERIHRNQW